MPDDADELILKMQHLEAQARAQEQARSSEVRAAQLKTKAQKMAFEAQQEVEAAEAALQAAEAKQAKAHDPGTPPLQAADLLLEGKQQAQDAHNRAVKARARLNFALDQMDEAERQEYLALQADARAETHGQLAEDPTFKKP
ncbi:MAG TPA: hypothetical protein VLW85_23270 [Myxococcales bacterium]|nr:hypothetical protein [Myxococcales bacterium]